MTNPFKTDTWAATLRALMDALALLPLLAADALFVLLPDWFPAPALLPLAVAAVAALSGPEYGAGYGLFTGVFYGLGQPEALALPLALLALSLLGYVCGRLRVYLPKGFPGACLLAASLLLCLLLPRALWWIFARGAAWSAAFALLGGELVCSLLCFPAVYLLYLACQKVTRHLMPVPQAEV